MAAHSTLLSQFAEQLAPFQQAKRWLIGFSGGMDSSVLLHLAAQLTTIQHTPPLQAVYIHHGLQEVAETWPAHCEAFCHTLAIPLQVINVNVAKQASIEQAARDARYTAFAELMESGDVLLTAQHQDDQAETLLFRLMRGTGLRGLTGIPKKRPLAQGMLVRPLLDTPHNHLLSYAKQHQLQWIEDPSNQETQYARNYLRHAIIPKLQTYWPQASQQLAQTANHLQEAQALLNELAQEDLATAQIPNEFQWLNTPCLNTDAIMSLSWERQKNMLSFWLNSHHILMPSTEHWQGWRALLNAQTSAIPSWKLQQAEIQRSANIIWLLSGHWLTPIKPIKCPISAGQWLALPDNGHVRLTGSVPKEPLFISYRQGGESINLANRGHRDLKRLFNETNTPRFIRSRLPLLFNQQGQLIAVANFPKWRTQSYLQNFSFDWRPNAFQD